MAVSNHGLAKLQIESVLTVPPLTVTEPRRVRQVLARDPDAVNTATNFQGCYQIVLYYNKVNEDEVGWFLAGWIVESLGKAVLEHPLLAGRLQRRDDGDGHGNRRLEIVSNDCGIRIVEARMPISMSEFRELSEKDDVEAELVFWKEIDEHQPEFSPLFYVQVTNFKCGGYSIGISCSLLLAEILIVDNFLKKWTEIHNIVFQNQRTETPIFYHPRLLSYESPPTDIICRTPSKNGAQTMVFKITADKVNFNMEFYRGLAIICVEEAEKKHDRKMGSQFFSLFVAESSEVIRVENCSRSENSVQLSELKKEEINCTSWDDFGEYEVKFHEGNKAALVSRWIGSVSYGHVMAIPSPNEAVSVLIVVTLPFQD